MPAISFWKGALLSGVGDSNARAQNKGAGEKALLGEKLPIDSGGFFWYLTERAFFAEYLMPIPVRSRAGASLIRPKDSPKPPSPALQCNVFRSARPSVQIPKTFKSSTDSSNFQEN